MNHGTVDIFRRELDKINISDFYGLISPGLTCYLNCILQVLFMTEEFRARIKRCNDDATALDKRMKCLFTALEKNQARTHDIARILGIADVYEQRDAAEYFEKMLCLMNPHASKIFKGGLEHTTTCCTCKSRNNALGFFWILPLSIKDPYGTYIVEKGFEDYFRKEKVSGENKIYCGTCDEKQDAIVMCEMTQPPEILTLLLKRFHYNSYLQGNVKVDCEAQVPLVLHIKDCTYDLYALVKHYGQLTGGHYVALIYSSQTKEWYSFNDETVRLERKYMLKKTYLRSRSSYLLMYKKRSRNPENRNTRDDDAEVEEKSSNKLLERNYQRQNTLKTSESKVHTVAPLPSKSHPQSPETRRRRRTHTLHCRLPNTAPGKTGSAADSQRSPWR
ncbi:unnamed protein product [Knipowitschia caucasica]